mmetsp:Transcript_12447/g.29325  ORF Transcript_12447/g.29325 Transcript_12447/m.29325 type:complete len:569 (+) Transcript_12447:147-1853(+)
MKIFWRPSTSTLVVLAATQCCQEFFAGLALEASSRRQDCHLTLQDDSDASCEVMREATFGSMLLQTARSSRNVPGVLSESTNLPIENHTNWTGNSQNFSKAVETDSHFEAIASASARGPNSSAELDFSNVFFASTSKSPVLSALSKHMLSSNSTMTWSQVWEALSTFFYSDASWDTLGDPTYSFNYSLPASGSRPLRMHIYLPPDREPPSASGWPVMLCLPGGRWGFMEYSTIAEKIPFVSSRLFHKAGSFALVSVDLRDGESYVGKDSRPSDTPSFPEQLQDALAALKFLRSLAASGQVRLDTQQIVVEGHSSGGNIAALLPPALAQNPELAQGMQVAGVIMENAPTDLLLMPADDVLATERDWWWSHNACRSAESQLIGCGRLHNVSLGSLIHSLIGVRGLIDAAGKHPGISFDLKGLAELRTAQVTDELLEGVHLGFDLSASEFYSYTQAFLSAVAASPTVQVIAAHLEGHTLPPYFIHTNTQDDEVPALQSVRMAQALHRAGVDFTFFESQFGGHTAISEPVTWMWLLRAFSSSVGRLALQQDLVTLLPAWLSDIGFLKSPSAA